MIILRIISNIALKTAINSYKVTFAQEERDQLMTIPVQEYMLPRKLFMH